ncbi:flagellar hook protein FlgE [Pelagibius litoralis]|uniref:Flagellar hook protein FlgE n=1 Tax=Pelagibius litoralis TaxID=374515 RepID=A0A967KC47_9PROT|nr:flagellar hook protein FlgE [Pelagibius litoralis]NIA69480.1 flagellar hook protein FlgE [Pelagibius litoralis]
MSIYGAMFAGVSGLAAQSNALGMISDNIANVNTVGYKGVSARFSTLVTQAATQTTHTPGGVSSAPYSFIDRQGLLQGSASGTDLAVAGQGFFVVNESANPGFGDDFYFTRAGSFNPDENGNLVNAAGYYLQGYDLRNGTAPPSSSTFTGLSTVNIANLSGSAAATTNISLGLNLPSNAADGDSHFVTTQVFDSLGNSHDMNITFTKVTANEWTWTASDPTLDGGATSSGTAVGSGAIIFDGTTGSPSAFSPVTPTITLTGFTTGAGNEVITVDLGTIGSTNGLSQFGGNFTIGNIDQDGVRFGNYTGININDEGIVTAVFDNGQRQDIYQLPLGMFRNPNGLQARSGNVYLETDRSGNFQLNLAGAGGAGDIAPAALEASTVDLAEEFTKMIITQRAYSANTKVITTADSMLEELIRVKR